MTENRGGENYFANLERYRESTASQMDMYKENAMEQLKDRQSQLGETISQVQQAGAGITAMGMATKALNKKLPSSLFKGRDYLASGEGNSYTSISGFNEGGARSVFQNLNPLERQGGAYLEQIERAKGFNKGGLSDWNNQGGFGGAGRDNAEADDQIIAERGKETFENTTKTTPAEAEPAPLEPTATTTTEAEPADISDFDPVVTDNVSINPTASLSDIADPRTIPDQTDISAQTETTSFGAPQPAMPISEDFAETTSFGGEYARAPADLEPTTTEPAREPAPEPDMFSDTNIPSGAGGRVVLSQPKPKPPADDGYLPSSQRNPQPQDADDEIRPVPAQSVEDAVQGAQQQARGAVQGAQQQAGEVFENAQQQASDAVQGAQQQASDAVQGAKQQASDAVQGAKQQAGEAFENAQQSGQQAIDTATETLSDMKSSGTDALSSGVDKLTSGVMDNVAGVGGEGVIGEEGISAGIGASLGIDAGLIGAAGETLGASLLLGGLAFELLNQKKNAEEQRTEQQSVANQGSQVGGADIADSGSSGIMGGGIV
tara:strand:+ start:2336 stop:3976 length:1641 start_codon:yes stop_codon:yes gene_type:complete